MPLTDLAWIPQLEPWQLIGIPVFTVIMGVAVGLAEGLREGIRDRLYKAINGQERPGFSR